VILSHGTTNLFAAIVPAAMRHADPWLMTPALVAAHLLLSLVSHRKPPLLQPAALCRSASMQGNSYKQCEGKRSGNRRLGVPTWFLRKGRTRTRSPPE
jgi:hypothetical protein